jgi:plastocyanin
MWYVFRSVPMPAVALAAALLASTAGAVTMTIPFRAVGTPASAASGQLTVRTLSPTSSFSALILRGLTPNTAYVASYHTLGPASSDPCASDGPVTLGFPDFKTGSQGQATVLLRADPARLRGVLGAYVDVRSAASPKVVALCASVLGAGATPAARSSVPATQAAGQTIEIGDNFFMPAALSVTAGTTVTWIHTGKVAHNVLSLDLPGIQSAVLRPGDRYSYTFKTPGTFTYYCSFHAGMSAKITVTPR